MLLIHVLVHACFAKKLVSKMKILHVNISVNYLQLKCTYSLEHQNKLCFVMVFLMYELDKKLRILYFVLILHVNLFKNIRNVRSRVRQLIQ